MNRLKDEFSWAAYAKFSAIVVAGFATSSLLGVPASTAFHFTAGALLSFPAAYAVIKAPKPEL